MQRELNVLALIKGEERYVFVYDDQSFEGLIEKFQEWAADSELSFSWFDAAVMTDKARQQVMAAVEGKLDRSSRIVGA